TKPLHLSDLDGVLQRALLKVHPVQRTEHAAAPEAVLDRAVIGGLRELRELNQPDPLKELIELFVRDAAMRLEKMQLALDQRDGAALASASHTLKGSASNLGARRLARFCVSLEKGAKTEDWAEAADILLDVRSEFQAVERELL